MKLSWADTISLYAFNATAFAIFGLLFVSRPTTWLPTLMVLIASVAALFFKNYRSRCLGLWSQGQYQWIAKAFLVWFLASLLLAWLQSAGGVFNFPDNELRMVLALTLLAMLAQPNSRSWFLLGLALAGFAAVYWALQSWPWTTVSRVQATTNNAIHFGNLSAVVALLSATVAFCAADLRWRSRTVFILAAIGGAVGAASSLSRSSFVVFLCLVPIGFVGIRNTLKLWLRRLIFSLLIAISVGVAVSPTARDRFRISEGQADIKQMAQDNYMSSLGARVAMWKTAWLIFEDHPLIGVGPGRFQAELIRRIDAGDIPSTGTYNQPHSDIMHSLSSGGLFKLFAYLGILFAPFIFFYKQFRDEKKNSDRWLMSVLGMQVVGAYFLTGLTNSNFDLQIYSTTYAVLVCVLAKLSSLDDSAEINASAPSKPSTPAAPCC
jgi:O-antigen ligase